MDARRWPLDEKVPARRNPMLMIAPPYRKKKTTTSKRVPESFSLSNSRPRSLVVVVVVGFVCLFVCLFLETGRLHRTYRLSAS